VGRACQRLETRARTNHEAEAMDARSKEERDDRGFIHDPEKAAEKEALEAAFEIAMRSQGSAPATATTQPAPAPEDRGVRVFSFASPSGEASAAQGAPLRPVQEIDEVEAASPAFGRPTPTSQPCLSQAAMGQQAMGQSMCQQAMGQQTAMSQGAMGQSMCQQALSQQSMGPSPSQSVQASSSMHLPASSLSQKSWTPPISSPLIRPGSASRTTEERLQHLEELVIRCHEMQMRRQQDVEALLAERCALVFQEVSEAMIPRIVEHMIERLAQTMDFSELRDQLIESFSASTDLLPVVEERSEAILTTVQEEAIVQKSLFSDVSRLGNKFDSIVTNISDLAGNAMPRLEDVFLDRLDELQRYLELAMTNMDFARQMPPMPQAGGGSGGYDMPKADPAYQPRAGMNWPDPRGGPKQPVSQRQRGEEGQNARATTLPSPDPRRRPETAEQRRRRPDQSQASGQGLAHGPGSAGPRMVTARTSDGDSKGNSGRGAASMNEWPWQPRSATPPPGPPEEEVVVMSPKGGGLPAAGRTRPSDLFGMRKSD